MSRLIRIMANIFNTVAVVALTTACAVAVTDHNQARAQELECLAKNIYYEARGEPVDGQIAVAQVTMHRVNSSHFPNTVCEVVYERRQFSWTHTVSNQTPQNEELWAQAQLIAREVYDDEHDDLVSGATFYHADYVNPSWNRYMTQVGRIGVHIFYYHEGR